mmetsp:Transcript_1280/g.3209  ORF Transcript_1280/g.3209 Transcript_1280/m.3209 type:complete len:309 (+) Transcript_1280:26-952(+)
MMIGRRRTLPPRRIGSTAPSHREASPRAMKTTIRVPPSTTRSSRTNGGRVFLPPRRHRSSAAAAEAGGGRATPSIPCRTPAPSPSGNNDNSSSSSSSSRSIRVFSASPRLLPPLPPPPPIESRIATTTTTTTKRRANLGAWHPSSPWKCSTSRTTRKSCRPRGRRRALPLPCRPTSPALCWIKPWTDCPSSPRASTVITTRFAMVVVGGVVAIGGGNGCIIRFDRPWDLPPHLPILTATRGISHRPRPHRAPRSRTIMTIMTITTKKTLLATPRGGRRSRTPRRTGGRRRPSPRTASRRTCRRDPIAS